MRRIAPPKGGRLPQAWGSVVTIAICLATLAGLAGVDGAEPKNNSIQQQVSSERECVSVKASGMDVRATKRAPGGGGKGQRAAAEDAPAVCRVDFSLRVPAVKPAVSFTGAGVTDASAPNQGLGILTRRAGPRSGGYGAHVG
jgi:hypothetical protein